MGWFDFSKKLPMAPLFEGFTDWHCHILPGVDDGFQRMEDSLDMLARYAQAGVSKVWFTPHVMEDVPNTPAELRERFAALKAAYDGPVELHLASENMLDNLFADRLEAGDLLPFDNERLLVETSYYNPPLGFREMLRNIVKAGWEPVLAHPERYRYMKEEDYQSLHREGILFQLNLPSMLGLYGSTARGKAEWLLEKGMYMFSATDLHQRVVFEKLMEGSVASKYHERLRLLL